MTVPPASVEPAAVGDRPPTRRRPADAPVAMAADRRLAFALVAPAVGLVAMIAVVPLFWTMWDSLHLYDLRMPWLGKPFVGLGNYAELLGSDRFWAAMAHTGFFMVTTVSIELVLGLMLALAMNRAFRGRGIMRASVLVPWAIPTIVAGLLWRFMFDAQAGIANVVLVDIGILDEPIVWFIRAATAWVPVILADVWKMTPFVALLLLAGLQNIDETLYEAAAVDGASPWWRLWHITIPLLKPAILVTLIFRTLDAFRCFDLIYVLTGGGPGTSTEPIVLLTFNALLQNLRFGYGSALSVVIFLVTFALAALYVRGLGESLTTVKR